MFAASFSCLHEYDVYNKWMAFDRKNQPGDMEMRKSRLLLLLICAMVSAFVVIGGEAFSRILERTPNVPSAGQDKVKKWQTLTPFDEAMAPTDPRDRALRESKNRRYNSVRSDQLLTDGPDDAIYGRIDESPRPSAIPSSQSAAAILGTVIRVQPHLSEDRKIIYTEFTVRVEEVFKTDESNSILAGTVTTVTQEGGAIRLRNGRILRYFVGGTSTLPKLNGRYVLFLAFIHDDQDLSILTGYELRDGKVTSLEEGGAGSRYANSDEATFLNVVRSAATKSQYEELKFSGEWK